MLPLITTIDFFGFPFTKSVRRKWILVGSEISIMHILLFFFCLLDLISIEYLDQINPTHDFGNLVLQELLTDLLGPQ